MADSDPHPRCRARTPGFVPPTSGAARDKARAGSPCASVRYEPARRPGRPPSRKADRGALAGEKDQVPAGVTGSWGKHLTMARCSSTAEAGFGESRPNKILPAQPATASSKSFLPRQPGRIFRQFTTITNQARGLVAAAPSTYIEKRIEVNEADPTACALGHAVAARAGLRDHRRLRSRASTAIGSVEDLFAMTFPTSRRARPKDQREGHPQAFWSRCNTGVNARRRSVRRQCPGAPDSLGKSPVAPTRMAWSIFVRLRPSNRGHTEFDLLTGKTIASRDSIKVYAKLALCDGPGPTLKQGDGGAGSTTSSPSALKARGRRAAARACQAARAAHGTSTSILSAATGQLRGDSRLLGFLTGPPPRRTPPATLVSNIVPQRVAWFSSPRATDCGRKIRGDCVAGDIGRKITLRPNNGFRLPSLLDNRPLRLFNELDAKCPQTTFVSRPKGPWELTGPAGVFSDQ